MMPDRRQNKWRFNKEVNFGNVVAIVVLSIQMFIIFSAVSDIRFKVNLMWDDYSRRIFNQNPAVRYGGDNEKSNAVLSPVNR